jgi:hypothetical protein
MAHTDCRAPYELGYSPHRSRRSHIRSSAGFTMQLEVDTSPEAPANRSTDRLTSQTNITSNESGKAMALVETRAVFV